MNTRFTWKTQGRKNHNENQTQNMNIIYYNFSFITHFSQEDLQNKGAQP